MDGDLGPGIAHGQSTRQDLQATAAHLSRRLPAARRAGDEPLAWAFAALMDPRPLSRAELKMACLRRIAGLKARTDPFLVNCVENYLQLTDEEAVELEALRARKENREVQAMALTWSEQLEAKGEARGEAKGGREILLSLLAERTYTGARSCP